MSIFNSHFVSKETLSRLRNHGITLDIKQAKPRTEPECDSNGYVGGNVFILLASSKTVCDITDDSGITIKSFLEESICSNYGNYVDGMRKGFLLLPIFDIGTSEMEFTTTESEQTGWMNLMGAVYTDTAKFLEITGSAEYIPEQHLDTLKSYVKGYVDRACAEQNNQRLDVTLKNIGADGLLLARDIQSTYLVENEVDSQVNNILDELVDEFDKSIFKLKVKSNPNLIKTGLDPMGHINKELEFDFGFMLAFGTSSFNQETAVSTVALAVNSVPSVQELYKLLMGNTYQELVKNIKEIKGIKDTSSDMEYMALVTSRTFQPVYNRDYMFAMLRLIFSMVKGVELIDVEADTTNMPF